MFTRWRKLTLYETMEAINHAELLSHDRYSKAVHQTGDVISMGLTE